MFGPIKLRIPIVDVFKNYQKSFFRPDILAGLTIAGVAIPQAMAYAQLAGLDLTAGLFAAIISMIIFALLTASKYVIMGPDAAMAALAGSAVIPLAEGNGAKAIALVAVLSVMIGVFAVISVFARLGYLAEFLSRPILLGYMAGLALVVISTQLPSVLGVSGNQDTNLLGSLVYLITNLGNIHLLTFIIGTITLIFGVYVTKKYYRFPAGLILLATAIIVSYAFRLADKGVLVIGDIQTGLSFVGINSISWGDLQYLIVPALAMMLIAYANTISTARTFGRKDHTGTNTEQEFLGLGVSNIGAGLVGGLPVSASGVRTAINFQSKPRSQFAQIFGSLIITLTVLFFTGLIKYLPAAVLAVIIILAVIPLFNYKELKSIWHAWRSEAVLAIITAVGVAMVGIYQGLLLAVMLAVANIFRKSAFPYDAILGVAKDGSVHDMHRPPKTIEVPGLKIYRFDAPLYFANSNHFRRRVLQLIDESKTPVKWFLWDAETVTHLDSTSGQMLLDLIKELKHREIVFGVARMKGTIRNIVHHSHRLSRVIQNSPHFSSIGDAIEAYREEFNIQEIYHQEEAGDGH